MMGMAMAMAMRGSEARVRATVGSASASAPAASGAAAAVGSCLFWLPDPLTPFAKASLSSTACFDLLGEGACLVALEWWTSGRAAYTGSSGVGSEAEECSSRRDS